MKLDALATPPASSLSGRFFLVSYLPTYAAVCYLLVLLWSGAPAKPPSFSLAWRTAEKLSVGALLLILFTVALVALILHPLQLPLVRVLEGYWPRWLTPLVRYGHARQAARLGRHRRAATLPPGEPPGPAQLQRAGVATTELRTRFPDRPELLRPTALGNVLASMEERAGTAYGWDTTVVWPRLYPLLGENVRAIVDDRRTLLDISCRLTVTAAVSAAASAALLAATGWWLLLALVPLALSRVAYHAAVRAAISYGESVRVAFDLHRFDLYPALRLDPPANLAEERSVNRELATFWRQGRDFGLPYVRSAETEERPAAP